MDSIEQLVTTLTTEGKSAAAIAKAVSEHYAKSKEESEKKEQEEKDREAKAKQDEEGLRSKVKSENDDKQKKEAEQSKLTAALRFTMGADKFIEEHKTVLPKEVSDIFAKASKESFDSEIEKANAIRSGVVESFFSVQANIDLLTPSQKSQVEDYLKLTRKARDEKSEDVFTNVLEPAMHMVKQLRKAEELAKTGRDGSLGEGQKGLQAEIIKRMSDLSKKHYGVKSDAT